MERYVIVCSNDRKKRKGRDWSSVNVERFMEEGFNDLSESEEEEEELKATAKRKKKIQSSARLTLELI